MKNRLLQIGKSLIFIGTGILILYFVYTKFEQKYLEDCLASGKAVAECSLLKKVWADFLSVKPIWIILACLAFMVSNLSRAYRWKQMLDPMGYKVNYWNGFWSIMLGYFANLGFPRIGEVVRGGSMTRYEKIPLEKTMGTIVADRVIDAFSFGIILCLALIFEFEKLWSYLKVGIIDKLRDSGQNFYLWLGIIILIVSILVLIRFRQKLYSLGFVMKIRDLLVGFWEGMKSIRHVDRPLPFILHSVNIWLMYYLMTYLTFLAFAPTASLGLSVALLVFVFGSLGMIIPAPGGMGSYQGLVALGVSLYGVSMADGFSYANINFFSIQIFCNIFFGMLALFILPVKNRRALQRKEQAKSTA